MSYPGTLLLATVIGPEEIGRRIKLARERKGWSQLTLAMQANVSPTTVSRWERGMLPPVRELVRLAGVLEIDADELVAAEPSDDDRIELLRQEIADMRALFNDARAERHDEHHELGEHVARQSALLERLVDAASDLSREIAETREVLQDTPPPRKANGTTG